MTNDTQPTEPLPDPAAQWVLQSPQTEPKPRRRVWPWLVAAGAVALLAVVAWVAGEQVARGILERTVREQIVTNLSLPADQVIDVDVPGQVLPQLIGGTIDEITVTSDDVPFQGLTGDVVVAATGVPVRGDEPAEAATGMVTFDEAQLQALLATLDDFPAETVTLDAPAIAVETELNLFALSVPVGVTLVPSVAGGDLVLTPSTLRVAGAEVTADALSRQFGAIAGTVIRDWQVCIAQYVPAGLELTGIEVGRDDVVATFDIDGAIIRDESLQLTGTCD